MHIRAAKASFYGIMHKVFSHQREKQTNKQNKN